MSEREAGDLTQEAASEYADIARTLLADRVAGELLKVVVSLTNRAVGPADGAGVTMQRKSGFHTAAETEPWVRTVDHIQYELNEGPCLSAIEQAAPIRVMSLADDDRFSRFGARAAEFGVLAALSIPLKTEGGAVGALNMYSRAIGKFTASDEALAGLFGEEASSVLAGGSSSTIAEKGTEQLQQALRSREVIGQAIGIMMEREACGAEEAFERLRRLSQNRNIKLRDLAQRVIESGKGDASKVLARP